MAKYFSMLFLIFPIVLIAQTPSFGPQGVLKANGVTISVTNGHANPFLFDWDEDGLKDLIVGHYGEIPDGPNLRLYKNSGTNAVPVWTDFSYMKADGQEISLSRQ